MRRLTASIAALALIALAACDDPESPKTTPPPEPLFKDLSKKWHVLHNLETAYVAKNYTEYDRLIDNEFVFIFDPQDFAGGKTPEQWDRAADVPATTRLLQGAENRDGNRIIRIELDIQFEGAEWTILPDAGGPGEDWHTTTVHYIFTMEATNDWFYVTDGQPKAEFIVRNAGTEESPLWRLVRWFDKANEQRRPPSPRVADTEPTSWGQVKALHG